MTPQPCVFADLPQPIVVTEPGPASSSSSSSLVAPVVLTDLSAPPRDAHTLQETARILAPSCDAVLLGDHQDRADYPPTLLARLVAEPGATPWITLACRDRNRIGLEQELHGLAYDGLATVLAITGDGRAFDVRPDVTQVFDLDSTRLAGLAAAIGIPVAVAETPTAPPVHLRPLRVVQKQRAGAGALVLNHVADPQHVQVFIDAARRAGLTIPVIACVPVYTDERSAAVLDALPGLQLDPAAVGAVLTAADPVRAGVEDAVRRAVELLSINGIAGVNLSGLVSSRGTRYAAELQADIGHRVRDHVTERRI